MPKLSKMQNDSAVAVTRLPANSLQFHCCEKRENLSIAAAFRGAPYIEWMLEAEKSFPRLNLLVGIPAEPVEQQLPAYGPAIFFRFPKNHRHPFPLANLIDGWSVVKVPADQM